MSSFSLPEAIPQQTVGNVSQSIDAEIESTRVMPEHRQQKWVGDVYSDNKTHQISLANYGRLLQVEKVEKHGYSGVMINVVIKDTGENKAFDINRIKQQGVGLNVFRCPDRDCDTAFVRRHLVFRHWAKKHDDQSQEHAAMTDHPTLRTYAHGPKRPEYRRVKQPSNNGGKKSGGTRSERRKRSAEEMQDGEDDGDGGSAVVAVADRPKKVPRRAARVLQPLPAAPSAELAFGHEMPATTSTNRTMSPQVPAANIIRLAESRPSRPARMWHFDRDFTVPLNRVDTDYMLYYD